MDGPLSIDVIQKHLDSDRRWRERRHSQWTLNYELYRDTVIINRFTQRQSVNVPYMKGTWKTYAAQTNWPVDNYYEDKGNDEQKELYLNEYWTACSDRLKLDILEEVDRKQEWLYGRSFMKGNILDGEFHIDLADPQDVLVDRYARPWDLQGTARRITHVGIFRSISDCERNPMYDKAALMRLREFFATAQGLIKAGQNSLMAADKAQRMSDLGVPDVLNPILGETYVELNELQVKVWDEKRGEDVVWVVVTANGNEILMQKPMEDILGVNMFTWATWAGDVEALDFWSDGGADTVRPLNLVANARWSQKVENATLANYGMHFYDSKAMENWTPVGYDPQPFGFYPMPGDPNKVLKRVDIPEMADVFGEMDWIEKRIQTAGGQTAVEQGMEEQGSGAQTAQEIQILASKAKERAQNVSKYHKRYWEDIGNIFVALINANAKDMAKPVLHKKGPSGKFYKKELNLAEAVSSEGYKVKVGSKADKEAESLDMIKKLTVAQQMFPMNAPLKKISKEKVLDWLNLTPDERKEVNDFDDASAQMMAAMQGGGDGTGAPMPMPAAGGGMPINPLQPANAR